MLVIFTDLDDTIFQTRRKLPDDLDVTQLTPATLNHAGEVHSFATTQQVALWDMFQQIGAVIVPVTGRDESAFDRVQLQFNSWCIFDHGLSIRRPDGSIDSVWATRVEQHLRPLQDPLAELHDAILPQTQPRQCRLSRHQVRDAHARRGLFFMSVIKHTQRQETPLEELEAIWQQALQQHPHSESFWIIRNSNNLSLLPRHGKKAAVEYVLSQLPEAPKLTLGLGDSLSDLPFLEVCDFALTPQRGQWLQQSLRQTLP